MTIERVNAAKPSRWTTWLGLILVPVLVLGGLLWATWSSDQRLDTVRAAVVNQDEAVELAGQIVPMGRQLTAALVDSDRVQNLAWEQATLDGARAGLKTGKYAAMVVIPQEFSAAATSYAGPAADAHQATIQVETSPVAGIADVTLGKVVAQEAARVLNETLTTAYLDQIYIGFNQMGEQFVTMADAASQLAEGSAQLADGLNQSAGGAGQLAAGVGQAADGAAQLSGGTSQLAGGLNTMAGSVAALPDGAAQLADGSAQLSDGVGQYVDGINQIVDPAIDVLADYPQLVEIVQRISGDQEGLDQAVATMRQVQDGVAQLEALNDMSRDELARRFPCPPDLQAVEGGCDSYYEAIRLGIGSANDTMNQVRADDTLGPVIQTLDALPDQLAGVQLPEGGINVLDTLTQLRDGGEDLKTGAQQLSGGVSEFAAGMAPLVDGIQQSADGASQLADGAAQLSDGMTQLNDGAGQLADGMAQLADGGAQLADGTSQFADGLAAGKDQIPSYSDSDRQNLSEVVSSPVATGNLLGTATVGTGWATALMVLALWAGAMATFVVVRALSKQLLSSARPSAYLVAEAMLPGVIVVGIQAVAVTAIGQIAMGLPFGTLMGLLGITLLAGLAFVAVNHALVAWLGSAGRFVSLGLVIVAMAPMITNAIPGVFATVRAISPMAPALDAMRSLITGSSGTAVSVFQLVFWLLLGLAASAVAIIRRRTTTIAELIDP